MGLKVRNRWKRSSRSNTPWTLLSKNPRVLLWRNAFSWTPFNQTVQPDRRAMRYFIPFCRSLSRSVLQLVRRRTQRFSRQDMLLCDTLPEVDNSRLPSIRVCQVCFIDVSVLTYPPILEIRWQAIPIKSNTHSLRVIVMSDDKLSWTVGFAITVEITQINCE